MSLPSYNFKLPSYEHIGIALRGNCYFQITNSNFKISATKEISANVKFHILFIHYLYSDLNNDMSSFLATCY